MKTLQRLISVFVVLCLAIPFAYVGSASASPGYAPSNPVSFTILHTNDFHGQLEEVLADSPGTSSNPGMARVATIVNNVRSSTTNEVLLVDAGDEMQGSLLSNLQKGAPTIAAFNTMSYDVATFGNHEFDWEQTVLGDRTTDALYPYVTANIVEKDGADCASSGWNPPTFADAPYEIVDVSTATDTIQVAFIGVTTVETPTITIASATEGLCFKDPAVSISHYWQAMKDDGAEVIVVLSHLGNTDGGYGYGIPVYGDQTLAQKLIDAGTPVNLIIGGHSHTNLSSAQTVGPTKVVQAHYNGRKVGRADITVGTDESVTINWTRITVCAANNTSADCSGGPTPEDPTVKGLITGYSSDSAYQALINTEIGYTNVPIVRNYNGDSLMGYFINDAIYNDLNNDAEPLNDIDMMFNNPGGLRADITCSGGYPCVINYGMMFNVLPFGNQTIVGDMTGNKILELLHQSATLFKGALQPSGVRYKFFRYADAIPAANTAWAWGAYDVEVYDKDTSTWVPLDLTKTYRVGTNEFLAPAGQDGFTPFKYMTNISYWGDMLDGANRWVSATYTVGNPYNEALDGRITRDGNGDDIYGAGEIVPITVLHHNDSHGNLDKGTYVGYTQLATLIKQERLHNPERTLLLNAGDSIQGDAMMYYFKDAGAGYASDGTLLPLSMRMNPFIAVMNDMNYTAMTLGNHEFNFGSKVFVDTFVQANFPILGANMSDDGSYGINKVEGLSATGAVINVRDSISLALPTLDTDPVDVAILGITNHRVPNYELPSNIPGLNFSDPLLKAAELVPDLRAQNDVVLALTHIGFTENPSSVEIDANVDTNLAAQVAGIDAIIGGHSHTNPASGFGSYKYLPSIVADPDGKSVLINHAYRYNNTLGEITVGVRDNGAGGYEVVSQTGRYISVASGTAEDSAIDAIVTPYTTMLNAYNNTVIGQTTVAIDALEAYTEETNGANLQADAAVYELGSHGINVDFHLSGAMSNRKVAASGPYPIDLKVSDMFSLMPYENSLVVMEMNGPQLKAVLERAYRNYYYYEYVPGYGGYSYYTTCMLDINSGGTITYNDRYPDPYDPAKNHVVSLEFWDGTQTQTVDFSDASKYYRVSTVNYLAAGSCNFNNSGTSLWPLNQITNDTQYYVRDAVIDYITHEGTVSPAIEGRLSFITDTVEPDTNITAQPANPAPSTDASFSFTGSDADPSSGIAGFECKLDGSAFAACTSPKNYTGLTPGFHTFFVRALDNGGNADSTPASYTWLARAERLKNRGFNIYPRLSKIPRFWVAKNFGVTDGKYTRFKKEGLASVRIVGAPGTVKTLSQTIKMSGNATDVMTFSFWARGSSIPAAGSCRAQVLLYKGTVLKSKKTIPCDTGTYLTFQQKSITFTAGVPYTKVVVKFTYSKAKGSIWFDLVSLIK